MLILLGEAKVYSNKLLTFVLLNNIEVSSRRFELELIYSAKSVTLYTVETGCDLEWLNSFQMNIALDGSWNLTCSTCSYYFNVVSMHSFSSPLYMMCIR